MRVLGLIPARGGSKGIPGKNIKLLNGKPLIAYTIEQALKARKLERFIVSTDDIEIANCARSFGAEVPFLRPNELASSTSSSLSVILHALDFYSSQGEKFDALCLLQPTSPFRPFGAIDAAIEKYKASSKKSLVSVRRVPDHFNPHWTFLQDSEGLKPSIEGSLITRRQELPPAYHRDGAIYLLNPEFMIKEGKLLSEDLEGFEIESPALINLDTMEDWEVAEKYIIGLSK